MNNFHKAPRSQCLDLYGVLKSSESLPCYNLLALRVLLQISVTRAQPHDVGLDHLWLPERNNLTKHYDKRPGSATDVATTNKNMIPNVPFQSLEDVAFRLADTIDTFASYNHRNTCNISSPDLYAAFALLCSSCDTMLAAMSSSGRIGLDAP